MRNGKRKRIQINLAPYGYLECKVPRNVLDDKCLIENYTLISESTYGDICHALVECFLICFIECSLGGNRWIQLEATFNKRFYERVLYVLDTVKLVNLPKITMVQLLDIRDEVINAINYNRF